MSTSQPLSPLTRFSTGQIQRNWSIRYGSTWGWKQGGFCGFSVWGRVLSDWINSSLHSQESQGLKTEKGHKYKSLPPKSGACSIPPLPYWFSPPPWFWTLQALSLRCSFHHLIISCFVIHKVYFITPNSTINSGKTKPSIFHVFLIALNTVDCP